MAVINYSVNSFPSEFLPAVEQDSAGPSGQEKNSLNPRVSPAVRLLSAGFGRSAIGQYSDRVFAGCLNILPLQGGRGTASFHPPSCGRGMVVVGHGA